MDGCETGMLTSWSGGNPGVTILKEWPWSAGWCCGCWGPCCCCCQGSPTWSQVCVMLCWDWCSRKSLVPCPKRRNFCFCNANRWDGIWAAGRTFGRAVGLWSACIQTTHRSDQKKKESPVSQWSQALHSGNLWPGCCQPPHLLSAEG